MSKKKNNQRKPSSPSAEAGEYDDLPETISSSVSRSSESSRMFSPVQTVMIVDDS